MSERHGLGLEWSKLDARVSRPQSAHSKQLIQQHLAHYNLGVVLAEIGHLGDAADALRQAAQLMPHDRSVRRAIAHTHFNLGVLFERQQLFASAIDQFRRSLEFDESADAFAGIGVASFRLGRYEDAINMYSEGLTGVVVEQRL